MNDAATINLLDLPSLPLDERCDLPDTPAVYVVRAGETVLYIGQSLSMRS